MNLLLTRLRASLRPAGLHLGISVAIALVALGLIYRIWYPGELAAAQGVSRLVLILIGVDVVIGPLITLIIYAPGKKSLRFDLAVIAALQTIALLYGLQAIHGGRPAYVVFAIDRFDVVTDTDVERASLQRAAPDLRMSAWGPTWAGARMPEDPKTRSDILFEAFQGGPDLHHRPEYFLPLDALREDMRAKLRPMDELRTLNAFDDAAWQALLAEFGRPESGLGYLPMVGNGRDGAVMLDAQTGEVLGFRLLTPSFVPLAKPPTSAPAPDSNSAPASTPAPASSPTPAAPPPPPPPPTKGPASFQGVG